MPTGGENIAYGLGAVADEDPKVTFRRDTNNAYAEHGGDPWSGPQLMLDAAVEVYGRHHTQWQQKLDTVRRRDEANAGELMAIGSILEGLELDPRADATLAQEVRALRTQYERACRERDDLQARIDELEAETTRLRDELERARQNVEGLRTALLKGTAAGVAIELDRIRLDIHHRGPLATYTAMDVELLLDEAIADIAALSAPAPSHPTPEEP